MSLNVLDRIFLFLTVIITYIGISINYFQEYTPAIVFKLLTYGSFLYKGPGAKWFNNLQLKKAYFGHFYIFAASVSSLALIYLVLIFFFGVGVHEYARYRFEVLLQQDEPVTVIKSLTAMSLFTIQCCRRMYESNFLQVFAKNSKLNLGLYLVGYLHYSLCILSIVGVSPLFCGSRNRSDMIWIDFNTVLTTVPSSLLFLWAASEQYQSNIILANLRKNKETGNVITETYKVPRGRLFTYVSSPHRFCEIVLYLALALLLQTKTSIYAAIWVFNNQVLSALAVHRWYKETFKEYPPERYAILPCLL